MTTGPRSEDDSPSSNNPIDLAMEAESGNQSDNSPAQRLLLEQIELIKDDRRHRQVQTTSERIGTVFKLLGALAGIVAAIAVGTVLWDAHKASGLVVEAFSTPPEMAARGLTGQAAAARFLDRMRSVQDATDTARAASSYGNDWSTSFKVQIPGAGISIDDLTRWLRAWLGHETHVTGEIVRTPAGLELTVRAGNAAGQTFKGPADGIDALMEQAALALYRQQQPYRYAIWLQNSGRIDEGEAALRDLAFNGPIDEQPFAMAGLANSYCFNRHDCRKALALAHRALEIDPKAVKPLWNVFDAHNLLDQPEQVMAATRAIAAKGVDPKVTTTAAAHVSLYNRAYMAQRTGDFAGSATLSERQARLPPFAGNKEAAILAQMTDWALAHEPARSRAAQAIYGHMIPDPADNADIVMYRALALGDWAGVAARAGPGKPAVGPYAFLPTTALIARARARTGDIPGAEALVGSTALDCYGCLIARGDIAEARGERAAADRWYAEALRQGPSVLEAYRAWGMARLVRGDADGAIALLSKGAAKGPRSPEVHSEWGQALLAKGDARAALEKFHRAEALAPRWGRNQLLIGQALASLDKADEGRTAWLKARGLELSPGDRALVETLLKAS